MDSEINAALEEVGESINDLYSSIEKQPVNVIYTKISDVQYSLRQLDRVIDMVSEGKENMDPEDVYRIEYIQQEANTAIENALSKINTLERGKTLQPHYYRFGASNKKQVPLKNIKKLQKLQKDLEYLKKLL